MADLMDTQNNKKEIKEFEEEVVPNVTNFKTQETFTLPSKGLFYTNPNMKNITLRRMTIKEDKIRMRNEGEDKIRRDLLQACIVGEGIDVGQMTLFDINYLLFCLRRISLLNNIYKVKCVCPYCNAEFIDEIDLTKLKINYVDESNLPNFDVTLPISKLKIKLRYPSVNSTIHFRDSIMEYLRMNPNEDVNEILYVLGDMMYIASVNGESKISEELEDLLDNIDIVDSKVLKKAIKDIDGKYGIDDDILCQCPSCKKDVHHGLPITAELFTPSL